MIGILRPLSSTKRGSLKARHTDQNGEWGRTGSDEPEVLRLVKCAAHFSNTLAIINVSLYFHNLLAYEQFWTVA